MRFQAATLVLALSSVVSSLAAPGVSAVERTDSNLVGTVHDVVVDLESSITGDLGHLVGNLVGDVTAAIVPEVVSTLDVVVGALDKAIFTLVPVVTHTVLGLVVAEVEAVLKELAVVVVIVKEIVNALVTLVGTLVQDVLDLVLPEIIAVLALLDPFVEPIITFCESAVSDVKGTDALRPGMLSNVADIRSLIGSVVLPTSHVA